MIIRNSKIKATLREFGTAGDNKLQATFDF